MLQVNADQVWAQGYTGAGVIVAVVDSGVNYEHADVADHLWDGGDELQTPQHGIRNRLSADDVFANLHRAVAGAAGDVVFSSHFHMDIVHLWHL